MGSYRDEESAGCSGKADAAFGPWPHNPAAVRWLPGRDCHPDSRDSHRSPRLERSLAGQGTSPESSRNLWSS